MAGHSKWSEIKHKKDERLAYEAAEQRPDPRIELVAYVTPSVERDVRKRLEAVMVELTGVTGDVVFIRRHEPDTDEPT